MENNKHIQLEFQIIKCNTCGESFIVHPDADIKECPLCDSEDIVINPEE